MPGPAKTSPSLDFEPIARQVYDAFLVMASDAPIEGLFRHDDRFLIVSPSLDLVRDDGRSLAEWFNHSLRPMGMPILLVDKKPEGAVEIHHRSRAELSDGLGVVQTARDAARNISVLLPTDFPLVNVAVKNRKLHVSVSRDLTAAEVAVLRDVVDRRGAPLPLVVDRETPSSDEVPAKRGVRDRSHSLEVMPFRRASSTNLLPSVLRSLDEDESFWRDHYRSILSNKSTVEQALNRRRFAPTDACLVGTTFATQNIRAYLTMFSSVVLVMPLADQVNSTLASLGVTRRTFLDLVAHGHVTLIAPQSVDRYDPGFLGAVADARPDAVLWSRRLAAASFLDQATRNPLLAAPTTALDRRVILRALRRLGDEDQSLNALMRPLINGLTEAWPYYEHAIHVRGAMASMGGPLAHVSAALAHHIFGKDYAIELGAAAQSIEWASALGATYAPFESDQYNEVGHASLVVALHSGVERHPNLVPRATQFEVVRELLVIDNDVDAMDFVLEMGKGDLARVRDLVRGIARPSRTADDVSDIVRMWNSQVRAYERRPNRLRSMSLGGFALGALSKVVGVPDLVSISSVLAALLPAALTLVDEEIQGERASAGQLLDRINARLANVRPEAVLLARLRKRVRGMK